MEKPTFPARITKQGKYQSVEDHLREAAMYAAACLKAIGLEAAGRFAGCTHDVGKLVQAFAAYLLAAAADKGGGRGSVVHTFAGVCLILNRFWERGGDPYRQLAAELMAYAAGAHHGAFDCVDEGGHSGFLHRLDSPKANAQEAAHNFTERCQSVEEYETMFEEACVALKPVLQDLQELATKAVNEEDEDSELMFYCGMLARLLLSAVIEGDRRSAAEAEANALRVSVKADQALWRRCLRHMEEKTGKLSDEKEINRARKQISDACADAAKGKPGIYRLCVPTGAGKTLSSLRFALAHAAEKGKQRVLFITPLLSILEQNADVLRKYIGDDSLILEHHSNLVREREEQDEQQRVELLMENWDAPIIITTLVQFLNTLFDGKTSSIRRFQSLCGSVIVIDEVQSVPTRLLSLFNLALNFLATVCKATVVLCSATQPCLEAVRHPVRLPIQELVPQKTMGWYAFRRTTLVDAGAMDLPGVADFARQRLEVVDSLLIVCNKKKEAAQLMNSLSQGPYACFHLSAAMCPAHRRETVEQMKAALKQTKYGGKRVIVTATQVIEAGVDVSFACAIRLVAGMDNAVQTAGRCNRNMDSEQLMEVYLIRLREEDLQYLEDIRRAKTATEELLAAYRRNPEHFGNDLSGDEAIRRYYQKLYRDMPLGHTEYAVPGCGYTLYSLLSDNGTLRTAEEDATNPFMLQQAFRLAGRKFQVFDEDTETVLVPYGKGAELILELCSQKAVRELDYAKTLLEQAKQYSVSVYRYQFAKLDRQRAIHSDPQGLVYWLEDAFYSERLGFTEDPVNGKDYWG